MANLNRVLLIGRLTRDPETRSTKSGSSVVSFGLAVNRTYSRESGEKVEETCFIDIEAWGRMGENIAKYTRKGRQLFVEGRLKFDSWEKEGQRRSKLTVVAENFQFLDSGGGDASRGGDAMGRGRDEGRTPVGSRASAPAESTPQDDYPEAGGGGGSEGTEDIPF
jgi:single-strand DNA-binding protein